MQFVSDWGEMVVFYVRVKGTKQAFKRFTVFVGQ